MKIKELLLLILTILIISFAQILFRAAALSIKEISFSSLLTPKLIIAFILYGVSAFLWVIILKKAPISVAYPFSALTFFIVPILAFFILKEVFNMNILIGAFFIILGILISIL